MPSTQPDTRHGELGEEEDPAEVRGPALGGERHGRVAGVGERLHLRVGVLVGLVAVAQVDEHAVVAVDVGRPDRLAGDGQDPLALLAGRLGDQLLDPEREALDRRSRRRT